MAIHWLEDRRDDDSIHLMGMYRDFWNMVQSFLAIFDSLDQQFNRLPALKQMSCLRGMGDTAKLLENIGITVSHGELLEALESLQQRSLIESHLVVLPNSLHGERQCPLICSQVKHCGSLDQVI